MRRLVLALSVVTVAALGACQEGTKPPISARNPLADSADQIMFGISTFITDKGLLKAQLQADTGYFFDGNSRIEMRNEKTTFFTNTGERSAILTSKEGTYITARSTMEARKNVLVVTTDGKRLTTEQLHYNQGTNEISSDSSFVMTEPTRELRGIGFVSDPNLINIRVKRVLSGQGPLALPGHPH
ncbi:MAG TPA: LPS export ABC transporter periplasmic protein LptC [Gemmatimonadaceae bacterium]|nr:LPS export ABC transporter periplasmic protein LptC [Gemmatimonadaceae bacterium]